MDNGAMNSPLSMTEYLDQEDKISNDLASDSRAPPGPCVKSKINTKELELFGKYLQLPLDPMTY